MKARPVETITSNEDHVRMLIYDGQIPLDAAGAELLRIEQAQHAAERQRHLDTTQRLGVVLRLVHEIAAALDDNPAAVPQWVAREVERIIASTRS